MLFTPGDVTTVSLDHEGIFGLFYYVFLPLGESLKWSNVALVCAMLLQDGLNVTL